MAVVWIAVRVSVSALVMAVSATASPPKTVHRASFAKRGFALKAVLLTMPAKRPSFVMYRIDALSVMMSAHALTEQFVLMASAG